MPFIDPVWPNSGLYAGSLARYHRLRPTHTHDGDVHWAPSEVGMLDAFAGSNLAGTTISGGTYIGTPSNVFDGSVSTWPTFNMSSTPYVGLDHTTAQLVVEFYVQAPTSNFDAMPSELVFEESADNVSWTTIRTYSSISPWKLGEKRYFPVADELLAGFAGKWRAHRIRPTTIAHATEFGVGDIQFYATLGDSATLTGSLWSSEIVAGGLVSMDDNNSTTICTVIADLTENPAGKWIGIEHGHTPIPQIEEVRMQCQYQAGIAEPKMPTGFVVEGTNWAGEWDIIQSYTTPAWSIFESRRFTV